MNILIKIYCFLFRHDIISEGKFENERRTQWGTYRCLRCGEIFPWQYDN